MFLEPDPAHPRDPATHYNTHSYGQEGANRLCGRSEPALTTENDKGSSPLTNRSPGVKETALSGLEVAESKGKSSLHQLGDQFKFDELSGQFKVQSKLGLVAETLGANLCVDGMRKGGKKAGNIVAKGFDTALIKQAKVALRMVGSKMHNSVHDDAMPVRLHNGISRLFATMWPEIQKGVLDKLLLDKGLQFRDYRKQTKRMHPGPPSGCFQWSVATLLYSINPFDRSFWGAMRSPLFFLIKLVRSRRVAVIPARLAGRWGGRGKDGRADSPQTVSLQRFLTHTAAAAVAAAAVAVAHNAHTA